MEEVREPLLAEVPAFSRWFIHITACRHLSHHPLLPSWHRSQTCRDHSNDKSVVGLYEVVCITVGFRC